MEAQVHRTEPKREPTRTCAGCRQTGGKHELVRVVLGEDGRLVVDLSASAFGRGGWVHPRAECLERAAPRGFSKSFKHEIETTPVELASTISEAADRRVVGLLASARGSKRLAAGATAACEEIDAERAALVVVATDARAAAESRSVGRMIAEGRAAAWGTKSTLGAALGRGETGVVAVLDPGIARALATAIALSHLKDSIVNTRAGSRRSPSATRAGKAVPEEG